MKRYTLLILFMFLVPFSSFAQTEYDVSRAQSYLQEAKYYQKKAMNYIQEAERYLDKADNYQSEVEYYEKKGDSNNAKIYHRYLKKAIDGYKTQIKYAERGEKSAIGYLEKAGVYIDE